MRYLISIFSLLIIAFSFLSAEIPRKTSKEFPKKTTQLRGTTIQPHPWLVTVRQMQDAARQMDQQMRRYRKEMAKLQQDPAVMTNPVIKARVNHIEGNPVSPRIDDLLVDTEALLRTVEQVLNTSGTQ